MLTKIKSASQEHVRTMFVWGLLALQFWTGKNQAALKTCFKVYKMVAIFIAETANRFQAQPFFLKSCI